LRNANLIIGIMAIFACFGCSKEIATKSAQKGVDRIYINDTDPDNKDYPGGRGADELIIYTSAYGERTGTNQYGLEAIVQGNRVVKVAGNDSPIPTDGFVISGHGKALRWISTNLFPGVYTEIRKDSLHFMIDTHSKLVHARYFADQAHARIQENNKVDQALFDSLSILYSSSIPDLPAAAAIPDDKLSLKIETSLQSAKELFYSTFTSPSKEVRATWFRITAKSPAELEIQIKEIVDVGFNMICPETIYGGSAIYPGAHPHLPQHRQYRGWDPLAELVRLSKKYQLELVPWVWVYHVGRKGTNLVENKAQWLALSRQREHPSQVEKGYHFLCPSRTEVRKFWLEVYEKMINTYDIEGIQLDYIRYPVSVPHDLGFCYCDSCRRNFQEEEHPDPFEIHPETNPEQWSAWNTYRTKQISGFVAEVKTLLLKNKPAVKLSADVFPVPEESRQTKMQDWEDWLKRGYLDEVFTMSYTPDAESVKSDANLLAEITPEGRKAYVGLGPYLKFRPEILLTEIDYARDAGVDGVCLFAFQALTEEQKYALKKGSFRNQARFK